MGNSFNLDLDKYINRRNQDKSPSISNLKEKLYQIPAIWKVKESIRKFREKEEFVDIASTNSVHIIENNSKWAKFKQKISDTLLSKKTEELDVPIEDIEKDITFNSVKDSEVQKEENFFLKPRKIFRRKPINKKQKEVVRVEAEPDTFVETIVDNVVDKYSDKEKRDNSTFSENEIDDVIGVKESHFNFQSFVANLFRPKLKRRFLNRKSDESVDLEDNFVSEETKVTKKNVKNEVESQQVDGTKPVGVNKVILFKPQLQKDLKSVLKSTHELLAHVPADVIAEFKRTNDYQRYVEFLNKYEIIKKK